MMKLSRYGGNPNIGVFSVANENFAFVAYDTSDEFIEELAEVLNVKAVKTTVAGTFVVGSLVAMNTNGAIVSGLADEDELKIIRELLPVALLEDRFNAAGNNILVNDKGAIVNPDIDKVSLKRISDVLGVECVRGTIAGLNTVGSVCRVTNKGAAVHPEATDEDIQMIKDVLKVDVVRTTLNHGCRFVAPCVVANSKGAIVGDITTPIEMGKLEDALGLY
jgi:translation initiation factor 6